MEYLRVRRDLWRALSHDSGEEGARAHAWDGWCERPGYPLLSALALGDHVRVRQERYVPHSTLSWTWY
jgi:aminopeptidase N